MKVLLLGKFYFVSSYLILPFNSTILQLPAAIKLVSCSMSQDEVTQGLKPITIPSTNIIL